MKGMGARAPPFFQKIELLLEYTFSKIRNITHKGTPSFMFDLKWMLTLVNASLQSCQLSMFEVKGVILKWQNNPPYMVSLRQNGHTFCWIRIHEAAGLNLYPCIMYGSA